MNRWLPVIAALLVVLLLVGCMPGPNLDINTPDEEGEIAGFWMGIWHGILTPISFIVSLFDHDVQIYEVHNNGGWYNFGFLLGLSVWHGHAATRARKND